MGPNFFFKVKVSWTRINNFVPSSKTDMIVDLLHINEVHFYVFLVFVLTFIIQIIYWWAVYGRMAFYRKRKSVSTKEPVSIVLLFNDEFEKLKAQLPALLAQDYPDYEIVLVIQSINDDLAEYLEQVGKEYSNIQVVRMLQDLNFFKGNKFPLSIGIKCAKNDLLIFTEAGCLPVSEHWLEQIQSNFIEEKEIVLGYFRSSPPDKSPSHGFRRFANLTTAMNYFSFALMGRPYMGIGKNLAYRRSLHFKNWGFTGHYRISVGEDDLFINQVATKRNIAIAPDLESQVICSGPESFSEWFRFRKKYFKSRRYYPFWDKFFLNLFTFSYLVFLAAFIYLLIVRALFYPVIVLFILRLFSQLFIFKKCMIRLSERNLLLLSPINEIFLLFFDGLIRIALVFDKKDKWKT